MMKRTGKRSMIIIGIVCLMLAAIAGMCVWHLNREKRTAFSYSGEAFGNPLMGYAPSAWYETVGDDVTLLYADITWRELEPEEGEFDWESIEEENQFSRWRSEGKRIVLRFVCDIPGDEEHMDIPDWLYEKIDGAGTKYDTSYGLGFSPDYNDPDFIACHERAVAALGERYGGDDFISFIELGSLGHWGEWHVRYSAGIERLPDRSVRQQYVSHWVRAFPHARLLMRRPFVEAAQYGMGLFNDMAGHLESTDEWLAWIAEGGVYDETGEEDAMTAMPAQWEIAPIGGELTSSLEMEQMLQTDLERTVGLIRDSHTTFLGPKIADRDYADGYDALLKNMGYRLWISEAVLTPMLPGGVQVELTWQNSGVAPMYADWPVYLQVLDADGRVVAAVLVDISLSQLLPGGQIQTRTALRQIERWGALDRYTIQLGIVDPMTGRNAVRFAVGEDRQPDNALVLWQPR